MSTFIDLKLWFNLHLSLQCIANMILCRIFFETLLCMLISASVYFTIRLGINSNLFY